MQSFHGIGLAAIVCTVAAGQAQAQLKYNNCADATKADFVKVALVSRSPHAIEEPIQMALDKAGKIFWVERKGKIRMWDPTKAGEAATLVQLDPYIGSEFGASGIALDPSFESNNWLYVFWAMKAQNTDGSRTFRVSRFTVSGATINIASQKAILDFPFTNFDCCHTAGSMTFDFSGNLWIAVGNTTNNGVGEGNTPKTNYVDQTNPLGDDQRGSANTNSLLGKILRIKPKALAEGGAAITAGVGATYDIPSGNLFPVGLAKTRPEIYTMGHRNPYSISVDPYRNWLTWGDIGPDEGLLSEEHNLVTQPGFMGWPYFYGSNQKFRGTVGIAAADMDPAKPLNKSKNNTGLEELPPAQAAIRPYRQSAAVTGPIYYYDGRKTATYRLPPHFNKKWMFTDFNSGNLRVATPSEDGKSLTADIEFQTGGFMSRPLDLELGPDGALYLLEYDGWFNAGTKTSINRWEYRGTCKDAALIPPTPSTALRDAGRLNGLGAGSLFAADLRRGVLTLPEGVRKVELYDLKGSLVFSKAREGAALGTAEVAVPERLRNSLLKARFVTGR